MTSANEVSPTTGGPQSIGLSTLRLNPPPLGSISNSRWIVMVSNLAASVIRLAARMRRMALTMDTWLTGVDRCPGDQGQANRKRQLSSTRGSLPHAISRKRSPIARSVRCRPPRNIQEVPATVSTTYSMAPWPTTATRSRWPPAFVLRTQNPISALWNSTARRGWPGPPGSTMVRAGPPVGRSRHRQNSGSSCSIQSGQSFDEPLLAFVP